MGIIARSVIASAVASASWAGLARVTKNALVFAATHRLTHRSVARGIVTTNIEHSRRTAHTDVIHHLLVCAAYRGSAAGVVT
jgi:hypothetical protein